MAVRRVFAAWACAICLVLSLSCADAAMAPGDFVPDESGGGSGADGGATGCTSHAQCPSGWTCDNGVCVAPEEEENRSLSDSPPVATPHYVYALNPAAASVARIDPVDLQIEAIPVGAEPVALAALPHEDAAVVLSYGDGSLALVDSTTLPSRVRRLALKRQHRRLAVSPDGRFAVAYADPDLAPTGGAEGIVTVVDLTALRAGAPDAEVRFERAAGYRITDAVYRVEGGVATRLHMFAKSIIATINLADLTSVLPARVDLPTSMATDVSAREVVADADGTTILLRTSLAPEIALFDGQALQVATLPEIATDLDLLSDGSAAVAALRTAAAVAYIELPGDIAEPSGIQIFGAQGVSVGQVALPPATAAGVSFALAWTNASHDESFARIDLPSGIVTRFRVEKLVDEISVSPDGRSAIVLHRADPTSEVADPYERAVDRDEGYSVFDVATGYSQLVRTGAVRPTRYAFSPAGGYAAVALRSDAAKFFAVDAVNLSSLVAETLRLASAPVFMGAVPEVAGATPHRVFVSQQHPAGRISVIELDTRQVRTATGFTLNSEIE